MPDRELLEEYPLYRSKRVSLPQWLFQIEPPPIKMHCPTCGGDQTYVQTNANAIEHDDAPPRSVPSNAGGPVFRLVYRCVSCKDHRRYFLILAQQDEGTVRKVGQWPPWDTKIDKRMERALGEHAQAFRRGLISESQGDGIGAFGYYRRIVEQITDQLLGDIGDLIPQGEREQYRKALKLVAKTRVTEDRIGLG